MQLSSLAILSASSGVLTCTAHSLRKCPRIAGSCPRVRMKTRMARDEDRIFIIHVQRVDWCHGRHKTAGELTGDLRCKSNDIVFAAELDPWLISNSCFARLDGKEVWDPRYEFFLRMYGEILIYLLHERCDRETEKLRIKTDKRDVMIGVNWRQEEKLYKDFFSAHWLWRGLIRAIRVRDLLEWERVSSPLWAVLCAFGLKWVQSSTSSPASLWT